MIQNSALIAMSGGVDSSVAAYLMVRRGFSCMGATMRLYRNENVGLSQFHTCCSQRDIDDAAEVAFRLDIPYEVVDFTFDFGEEIIGKFIRTYEAGGTPNPCIDCNRYMKFRRLLDFAGERGLQYVVTGHYARIVRENGRFLLKKALDGSKDQSYVLYDMTQEQLSRTLFPMGELSKVQTRQIAREQGFVNAAKPDSQDICFVPDGDYVKFMERYTGKSYAPGPFLDPQGNTVGTHRGAVGYTIGQRRGLGLAMGEPVYVYRKDMERNAVFVGSSARLYTKKLQADDLNWIAFDTFPGKMRLKAKTRYRQTEQWADARLLPDGTLELEFDEPQRAVTAGQAVALYDGDTVLGGGTIRRAYD